LRGAQAEVIHGFKDERTFDRQIRLETWCTWPGGWLRVVPRHDRFFVEPHGEAATIDQRTVVRAPITDAIANHRTSICHGLTITARNKEGNMQHIWTVPVCKAIRDDDQTRGSCGHIYGFVGQCGDYPALMDSARFLLINVETLGGRVAQQDLRTPG